MHRLICLAAACLLLCGCPKKAQTFVAPGGSATVTETPGGETTVNVQTDEGSATVTSDAGSGSWSMQSDQGNVQAQGDESGATVTSESDSGSSSFTTGSQADLSEGELGLDILAGAKPELVNRTTNADGTQTLMAVFSAPGTVKEAYEFYKRELGSELSQDTYMSGNQEAFFLNREGDPRYAITGAPSADDAGVTVTISRIDAKE